MGVESKDEKLIFLLSSPALYYVFNGFNFSVTIKTKIKLCSDIYGALLIINTLNK